ncbi:hypothetical protein IEO21_00866 [Rhodonia placenta]|uniref:DUF4050 domain-containing protein n=1 Tax=Rhodonia placenta TaxID=104341 RepID=A0A8H7U714_9APHY|nr:hypothetical protein IEO21_00866 [Postia placenta]
MPHETKSSFQDRLAVSAMPPPGPAYFNARRALWWIPTQDTPRPADPSPARQRLEQMLSKEGAEEDDLIWSAGVERVWQGLTGGAVLKKRLPLNIVVKLLLAGWIRDGTWPRGKVAPEPDDELLEVDQS